MQIPVNLTIFCLWSLVISCLKCQFIKLQDGVNVKSLGTGCGFDKFLISENASLILETANFGTEYANSVNCKSLFKADGDCTILMQCSDFEVQPGKSTGECKGDYLLVKDKEKHKYCGADETLLRSQSHGTKLLTKLKTNKANNKYKGFKCTVSCCPNNQLSEAEVVLDFKDATDRKGEVFQTCNRPHSDVDPTCGMKGPPGRIVGGFTAEKHKYTWLALLTKVSNKKRVIESNTYSDMAFSRNHEPFCGGTLVSKYWIVTASHCTLMDGGVTNPERYRVVLGEWDRGTEEDAFTQVHLIEKQIRHPDYNQANYDSDIAMWKLKDPADLHHFRTICLPYPGLGLRNPMTVAGWGVLQEGGFELAGVLQEVNVPVVPLDKCRKALEPYEITKNMLCAGGVKGQDACQGDSGGPLMGEHPETNQTYLAGVVSWGIGCGREGLFGAYTKVSHYEKWIHGFINST